MGEKHDLTATDCSMVSSTRWVGLRSTETADLLQKLLYVDRTDLLMREFRREWPDWLELIGML